MHGKFRLMTVAAALLATSAAYAGEMAAPKGWGAHVFVAADIAAAIPEKQSKSYTGSSSGNPVAGTLSSGRGSGWGGALVVGAELGRDLAVMVEGQYLSLDQKYDLNGDVTIAGAKYAYDRQNFLDAGHAYAGFLTGHYRLPVAGYARPYVGLGVGMPYVKMGDDRSTALIGKAVAGVDVAVGEKLSIYGEYNYLRSMEFDVKTANYGASKGEIDTHLLRLGLKGRF